MVEVQGKEGSEEVEKVISNIPGADTVIESNDILVVIGETENLDKVMRTL